MCRRDGADDFGPDLAIQSEDLDLTVDETKTETSDAAVNHDAASQLMGNLPTQEYTCHGNVCECGWGASSCSTQETCAADCDDLKNACDAYGAAARWGCDQGCTCVGYGENECCCGTCTLL